MQILGYFDIFDIFGSFLLILNQIKKIKFKKKCFENLKNLKNLAQNGPIMGQKQIINRFLDNCKKTAKRAKKGQQMLILGYLFIFFHFWYIFVKFEPKKKNQNLKKLF